jgi:ribosomal 50S subunit-associated protein YjgA (DUF615 family)
MKPPAVNGKINVLATPLTALSNTKLTRVPLRAPKAVNNCKNIALNSTKKFQLEK